MLSTKTILHDLESDFGPFPHGSVTVFAERVRPWNTQAPLRQDLLVVITNDDAYILPVAIFVHPVRHFASVKLQPNNALYHRRAVNEQELFDAYVYSRGPNPTIKWT